LAQIADESEPTQAPSVRPAALSNSTSSGNAPAGSAFASKPDAVRRAERDASSLATHSRNLEAIHGSNVASWFRRKKWTYPDDS